MNEKERKNQQQPINQPRLIENQHQAQNHINTSNDFIISYHPINEHL